LKDSSVYYSKIQKIYKFSLNWQQRYLPVLLGMMKCRIFL